MSRIDVDPAELRRLAAACRHDASDLRSLAVGLGGQVAQTGLSLLAAYGIHVGAVLGRLALVVGGPDGLLGLSTQLGADADHLDDVRRSFESADHTPPKRTPNGLGPPPGDPYEVSVETISGNFGLDITLAHVGGGLEFKKVHTSDGKWHVSVTDIGELGITVGVGAEGHLLLGGKTVNLGAVAGASASGGGSIGMTWTFDTEEEANEFMRKAALERAKRAVASNAGPLGGWVLNELGDKVIGWDPPEPSAITIEGKIIGKASAAAGFATLFPWLAPVSASGEIEDLKIAGLQKTKDGETTLYMNVDESAGAQAHAVFGPSIDGSGSAGGKVAVVFDANGQPKELLIEGDVSYGGDKSLEPDTSSLGAFASSVVPQPDENAGYAFSARLDLTDPKLRNAAADFLRSVGSPIIDPTPLGPGADADLAEAGRRLTAAVLTEGTLTAFEYEQESKSLGGGASGRVEISLGIEGVVAVEEKSVTNAWYFDGEKFVKMPGYG